MYEGSAAMQEDEQDTVEDKGEEEANVTVYNASAA